MKNFLRKVLPLLCTFAGMMLFSSTCLSQTVIIDHHFTVAALPAGVTSDGAVSTTKAADGVCSQGMIQVNSGGFLQVDVSSCSIFNVNMKSTGASARMVTIKYKKSGDASYTTATTTLSVGAAAAFNFATLFPAIVTSSPISIRVEPTSGNIQVHDLYVVSNNAQSSEAEITAFKLSNQIGNEVINSTTASVAISVPLGTSLSPVVPQVVGISPSATISPLATAAQDFSSPVAYTVTAQDGTTKNWTVSVTSVASSAKEITAFQLSPSQIGAASINAAAGTISVTMPNTVAINNISPTILSISANATVSPLASASLNFTSPVVYTVTAQDNSTKTWTVNVTQVDPNATFTDYQAEDALFTGTVDNNHANYTGSGFINFASADNYIVFTVCQQAAGTQTAKFRYSLANDTYRKGNLYVNDVYIKLLDFPRTATFSDWAEETTAVDLLQGINNIRIVWDTTDGPNLDKLMLTGAPCNSYTLTVNATNGGKVIVSPERSNKKYFDIETVTLLAENEPALQFTGWSGDLTGTTNPQNIAMTSDKNVTASFTVIPTYKLTTSVSGIGSVVLSPAGGEYAQGTVVTVTAQSVLGSTFTGWGGDLSGTNPVTTITMNSAKAVTASFSSSYSMDFEKVIGFASVAAQGMVTPTNGGQCAADTFVINGPAEFNKLAEGLYNRWQAYKTGSTVGGMKKAPLVIMLKAGIYDGTQTLSTNGAKVFGNSMLDIPEQGDLTFMGESNVTFKIGINVKRAWNVLIRNISFQDYYDDGINVGYPETHHIWIDHCTFGHPTTRPANTEHPDGGCDVKDGASYITISWCLFRNSWKTGLVGHSDNNGATDVGRLKVTFANNYYLQTNSRNPRVRFGEVHVLNNFVEGVSLYGIAAANSAWVYAENNFYKNTPWAMYADRSVTDFKAVFGNNTDNVYTSKTGNYPAFGLKQVGNGYDDSGLPVITAQINPAMLNPGGRSLKFDELNPASVFSPSSYYAYTPFTAEETRVIVPLFAGADNSNFSSACNALPVSLQQFAVVLTAKKTAAASWTTGDEINAAGFEVEKSTNGSNFLKLGYVKAANTSGVHQYNFEDPQVAPGFSYYRLKQLDADGKYQYSKTVKLYYAAGGEIAVTPNPASGIATLFHPMAGVGATLQLVTLEGKMIQSLKIAPGTLMTAANVSGLAPGTYLMIFHNGSEKRVTKFVKQ